MSASPITCLNGQFLPQAQAMLPISSRGFRFGDGVFETIRLVSGVPYQWLLHLERLREGLTALRITLPTVDFAQFARAVIQQNRAEDGFLRIAVSRGGASRGYMPDRDPTPAHWAIEYLPPTLPTVAPARLYVSSMARVPLQCLPVNLKLAQGVGSTLALLEAHEHGCDEALQFTIDGMLCEAASANLFWLKQDRLFTPALTTACLRGTTRDAVLRLVTETVHEVTMPSDALADADAIFLTNSRVGIWPVASIEALSWRRDAIHPRVVALKQALLNDYVTYVADHRKGWLDA